MKLIVLRYITLSYSAVLRILATSSKSRQSNFLTRIILLDPPFQFRHSFYTPVSFLIYSQNSSYHEIPAINYGDDAFEGFVPAHVLRKKWDNTRQNSR